LRRAFRRQAKPLSSARAGQEDARFLTGGWSFRHRFRSWVILPLAMLMPSLSTPSPPHLDGAHTRSNLSVKNANKLPKMMTHD